MHPDQPDHRQRSSTSPPPPRPSRRPTPSSRGRTTPSRRGATSLPASARGCCGRSPPSSTSTSRSWRSSRSSTPGTRSATRAGRRATSATASTTTPPPRSGSSAGRSRWPGGIGRDVPRAARRGGHHRALELPDADRRLGVRPRARRRQHGRAQAGRADPPHGDPDRRAGPRGRPARGRAQRHPGQGLGRRRAVRHPPARAQGLLHRLHRRSASGSWPAAPTR